MSSLLFFQILKMLHCKTMTTRWRQRIKGKEQPDMTLWIVFLSHSVRFFYVFKKVGLFFNSFSVDFGRWCEQTLK